MSEDNQRKEVQFEIFDKEAQRLVPLSTLTFDFALQKILLNGVQWDSSKAGLTKRELLRMVQDFAELFEINDEEINGTDTSTNQ